MRCISYSFADKINLYSLAQEAKALGYQIEKYPHALQVFNPDRSILCHYFGNGTLVTWSNSRHNIEEFVLLAKNCCDNILNAPMKDSFSVKLGQTTTISPHKSFNTEILTLAEDDDETKLSLAFGFSQSIKLKYFEEVLETLITLYSPLITQLSSRGKIQISRTRIQQIVAQILETKSLINLSSDFFYPPKFFWNHPNLEDNYLLLHQYLDITERLEVINQKLDTLSETFSMFNSYLETRHSHFLEIIIILLIAMEIIFSFLNLHL